MTHEEDSESDERAWMKTIMRREWNEKVKRQNEKWHKYEMICLYYI